MKVFCLARKQLHVQQKHAYGKLPRIVQNMNEYKLIICNHYLKHQIHAYIFGNNIT